MDQSTTFPGALPAAPSSSSRTVSPTGAPWYCRVVVLAAAFIWTGIVWDISWHSAIGRDTFWTLAHICIHIGGSMGGLVCGWLILRSTFPALRRSGEHELERAPTVGLWGFRGPLGAWVTVWGALAMLTSAPFDNWWHAAYGLDVQILSPPHSVLAAGMFFHVVGGLMLVLGVQNREETGPAVSRGESRWLFVFAGGILISLAAIMMTEHSLPNQQHASAFYKIACAVFPFFLATLGRASRLAWPATTAAAVYVGLTAAAVWILPLFPAQPKLAPIFNPVTHMVPPMFPLLLIIPAFEMDLVSRWMGHAGGWKKDLLVVPLLATSFTVLFLLAQWNFSTFLISPAAKGWLFNGAGFFTFSDTPSEFWHRFWGMQQDALSWRGGLVAWVFAILSSGVGILLGNWMTRVRR